MEFKIFKNGKTNSHTVMYKKGKKWKYLDGYGFHYTVRVTRYFPTEEKATEACKDFLNIRNITERVLVKEFSLEG